MRIRLARSKLSLEEAHEAVRGDGRGATVVFSGSVRDREDRRKIAAIDYEAYESMALKGLERLAHDAEKRFGARIAVFHRLGRIKVGEASVLVAASAAHRAEAFAACREVLEELKRAIPVWKTSFVPAAAEVR